MKFIIEGELPGLNEIIAVSKLHYGKYAKMKKEMTEYICWQVKGALIDNRVNVKITWYSATKKRDPDNIAAGVKFILDGMVKGGIIKGDGYRHIGSISHIFKIDKEHPRIEVELGEGEE